MIERKTTLEKVILVGVITQEQNLEKSKEYLDELEFLALTAGGKVVKRFLQKMSKPDTKTYIGSGKLNEIADYMVLHHIETVIFDDELSPSQGRNIEKVLNSKILDRTNLILDIFCTTCTNFVCKNTSRISTM